MYLTSTNFDQHFADLSEDSVQFKLTCLNIAQGIQKKETSLESFILAAGSYLVNKDNEKRLKGVTILATILDYLLRDVVVLDSKEMEYLCEFLVDRLKDHHTVVPAVLKAIYSLMSLENFPGDVITTILTGIFQNISCQTQQPKDRLILYKIFAFLVENHKEEIAKMGPDFVYGVISSVENERNPQNLLYLFKWYPIFCKNVKLGHLTDEMFDILSCYFPVDYQPLNNESDTISREELSNALNPALYAIPEFGDLCIPIALEKLSSDLLLAKFDSLKLLMHGTSEFKSETYSSHSTDIISSIKRQIFETNNSDFKKHCCHTLTAVSNKLSTCELSRYDEILLNAYDMVLGNLTPSDKYFTESNLFLSAFAKGSREAAEFVVQKITQKLSKHYNIGDDKNKEQILKIYYVYTNILVQFEGINREILNVLEGFFYNVLSSENDLIKIQGMLCLGLITSYLSEGIKYNLIEMLKLELINQKSQENYKSAVYTCFESFAKAYPTEINKLIQDNTQHLKNINGYLEMIGSLVKLNEYTNIIMDITTNFCRKDLITSTIALKELRRILTVNKKYPESENRIITYLIQQRFVYKQILWSLSIINEIKSDTHRDFLTDLLYITKSIIGSDSVENQQVLVDELLPRILSNINDGITIVLISCLLTRLKSEMDFNNDHISYFVTNCFKQTGDDFLLTVSQELVVNLINKCKSDTRIEDLLSFILNFSEIFTDDDSVQNYNFKFVPLITKALIMRGHPQSSTWLQKMICLLSTSNQIIEGFEVVLSDDIDSLSPLSYSTIRLFYKQRFFTEVSTILINSPNLNYLSAFCIMLRNISNKIFASEFNKILPLIVESMDKCNDVNSLISLLNILQITIQQDKNIIIGNIDEVLPGLLKLFNFKSSMAIRILAIQSVEQFLNGYQIDRLSNYKKIIITSLANCIDDKKRLVRKVSADSRSKWFLFGENY